MTKNERNLIRIIETLCEAVSDTPCGCDCCPYADSKVGEQCEVYDVISSVEHQEYGITWNDIERIAEQLKKGVEE